MHGTTSFDQEQHIRLHFIVRVLLALLLILLFSMFTRVSGQKRSSQQQLAREEIVEAEQRLADLGYWTGPVDGVLDGDSKQALIAFQKIEGRKRDGVLSELVSGNRNTDCEWLGVSKYCIRGPCGSLFGYVPL